MARRITIRPLYANYWISVVHKHWSLCRYSFYATGVTDYVCVMFSVFSTLTAMSVDLLLVILLGLRYKNIVTLRRTYNVCVVSQVPGSFFHLNCRITFWESFRGTPSCLVIWAPLFTKIFRAVSHHQVQVQDNF